MLYTKIHRPLTHIHDAYMEGVASLVPKKSFKYCQTPVLGLGLGVDFTFGWDNNNNNNNKKKKKNPHLNFRERNCS